MGRKKPKKLSDLLLMFFCFYFVLGVFFPPRETTANIYELLVMQKDSQRADKGGCILKGAF